MVVSGGKWCDVVFVVVLEGRVVTVVLEGREVMVVLEGTIALIEEGMGVIVPKATSTPTRSSIPKTQSHREQITSP